MDLQNDTGQIGSTDFYCSTCGEVINPIILRNRLNQTPDFLRSSKKRKYAQLVGQGESDGQDQKGVGKDTQPDDSTLVGPVG